MRLQKNGFFILTGAPGVGKTAIVKELRADGLTCVDEPAREILAEQRAIGSDGIPERNSERFTQLLMSRSIESFEKYVDQSGPIIFDRGVIDSIGYAALFEIDTLPFEEASQNYRYNKCVFVLQPWRDIYVTDDERKMSFDDTIQFHEQILTAYRRLGYDLIEIPRGTAKERARFIQSQIKSILTL